MTRAEKRRSLRAIKKCLDAKDEIGAAIAHLDFKRVQAEFRGEKFPPHFIKVERKPKVYRRKKRTDRDPTAPNCWRGMR